MHRITRLEKSSSSQYTALECISTMLSIAFLLKNWMHNKYRLCLDGILLLTTRSDMTTILYWYCCWKKALYIMYIFPWIIKKISITTLLEILVINFFIQPCSGLYFWIIQWRWVNHWMFPYYNMEFSHQTISNTHCVNVL